MCNALPQTVLITGASSGIGRVTAIYLAQHGYQVVATSREVSRLDSLLVQAQRESLSISSYQLDVNNPASVGEVVPRILDELGRLDGLVNKAERFHRIFMRTLRALRDRRRYSPSVIVQNTGQVNVGGQQVNVGQRV